MGESKNDKSYIILYIINKIKLNIADTKPMGACELFYILYYPNLKKAFLSCIIFISLKYLHFFYFFYYYYFHLLGLSFCLL